jgi:hypothetical protein
MYMSINFNQRSNEISSLIQDLTIKGEIGILLSIYKKDKINSFIKDEVELAIFKSIGVCLSKLEFDKINLLINDPVINDSIRLAAKMAYDKRFLCGCYDKGVISEIPSSLKKCGGNCKCKTLKGKVNQTGN